MKWHYPAKKFSWYEKAKTLDLMMKRNKYRVTEIISLTQTQFENRVTETQQNCPMVNKKLILMYKKSPCQIYQKLTHDFFVAIRIEFPKS